MARLIGLIFALLASSAQADWRGRAVDNGAFFYGVAGSEQTGLTVMCIGRSAQGLDPVSVDAHETAPTANFSMRFEFAPRLIPQGTAQTRRTDLLAWTDTGGVRLPPAILNELNSVWEFELPMTDAFVSALFSTNRLVIGPQSGPHYELTTSGMAAALTTAFTYCLENYARMGLPIPPTLSAFVPNVQQQPDDAGLIAPSAMDVAAQNYIQRQCNGRAQHGPNAVLRGEIDGDGVTDVVLNWRDISCLNGGRLFCGASQCSVDVFLSQLFPRKGRPEQMLGVGISLQPLSNGSSAVAIGGSLSSCRQFNLNACDGLWYWTGASFEHLQTRPVQ